MYTAKKHIDEMCKKLMETQMNLIEETKGMHHYRPGDVLIREAFEGLTKVYFGQIQIQWQKDLKRFIAFYENINLAKKNQLLVE